MNKKKMNILICLDDPKGDYTRHAAVTIISLLETNKMNKIKIYVISSCLPKENIKELEKIVNTYNQEIKFIISDDIVPKELKKVIINRGNNIRGPRYRWFFPRVIKGLERILYMDCDVLVMKDISGLYNIDMQGKSIAGYYDIRPFSSRSKLFEIKDYINSGVILFDAKKYDMSKISVRKMDEINGKYSKYFNGWDQDKINIIFEDDILIAREGLNYQVLNKWFNSGLNDAEIVHCLEKPYVKYCCLPKKLINTYDRYLNKTKWIGYPKIVVNDYGLCGKGSLGLMCKYIYLFCFHLFWIIVGKVSGKYHH